MFCVWWVVDHASHLMQWMTHLESRVSVACFAATNSHMRPTETDHCFAILSIPSKSPCYLPTIDK